MERSIPLLAKKIPSSGESIPIIGMGSWQTFDIGSSDAVRAPLSEVLRGFSDLGGTVVDSSPMYGQSESVIGDLASAAGLRNRLFLATKVWTTGRQAGIRQMEQGMHRLRTESIDLMQVHNLVDAETHLETMREWKASGRIRYLGVTHYTASAHDSLAAVMESEELDFVQINYSVGEREAEKRILPLARERGIAVLANRPLVGNGDIRSLLKKPVPDWASEIDCKTWTQLLLKFVVAHPDVTCAIPATSKIEHLRDNMDAGRGRMPDAALRERIAREAR